MQDPFKNISIPVHILKAVDNNLDLKHINDQFYNKEEFEVIIENTDIDTWKQIRKSIEKAISNKDDIIIICNDYHEFTNFYSKNYLFENIIEANNQGASILFGCVGGFNNAVPLTETRYWVDYVHCTSFMIIYKRIFYTILDEPFGIDDSICDILSQITSHKMVVYPFVSIQRKFENSILKKDFLCDFTKSSNHLSRIREVYQQYIK